MFVIAFIEVKACSASSIAYVSAVRMCGKPSLFSGGFCDDCESENLRLLSLSMHRFTNAKIVGDKSSKNSTKLKRKQRLSRH